MVARRLHFGISSWMEWQTLMMLYAALFNYSRRKNGSVNESLKDSKWITDVDYSMIEQLIAEFVAP